MGLKKKKQDKVNATQAMYNSIPFEKCYEEGGIIEAGGRFTRMYLIQDVNPDNAVDYDSMIEEQKISALLNAFPRNVRFQFISHNELIDMDEYLKKILMPGDGSIVKTYNRVVYNMADIGHNNLRKVTYLVLSIAADTIDDAYAMFKKLDPIVLEKFKDIYGLEAKGLSTVMRLKVMYNMLNPDKKGFGQKVDLNGDGKIDLKNLKYMKLTTKDLVAPVKWKIGELKGKVIDPYVDYSILNAGTPDERYARSFFINSIPKAVSQNMISDFTNISSNMVLSLIYEPIDTQIGLDTVTEHVKENTQVVVKSKNDTIEDRKNHAKSTIKRLKNETERAYFEQAALNLLKTSVAAERKAFKCTITAVLYAPTLELLDRDTGLLKLSASKFAASIRPLDYQQKEGLQTSLPLCSAKVDVARILDSDRLSVMAPINIRDVIKRGGLYYGLNAINGNLVMLNRKNINNYNGVIAGSEHIGKTFQNKREIVNAFIGSHDKINIIAYGDEYDELVERLGGQIVGRSAFNLFEIEPGYGLTGDDSIFKGYALDAIMMALQDAKDFRRSSENAADAIGELIEKETARLLKWVQVNPGADVLEYVSAPGNAKDFPYTRKALEKLHKAYLTAPMRVDERDRGKRVFLYKVNSAVEVLMLMDHFWNLCIRDKKHNESNWLFIDPIDDCIRRIQGSEYISEFMTNASLLKTVFTMVVQESASLIANTDTAAALDNLVTGCGYVKFLNLGPNERRRFCDRLNIPNTLVQYVANVGLGKGLIITPSSNVPFEDSFLKDDEEFKNLFAREIEQTKFDGILR